MTIFSCASLSLTNRKRNHWFHCFILLTLTSTTFHRETHHAAADHPIGSTFVQTKGTNFVINGNPFYLNGFNAYWMMIFASDPSTRDKVTNTFRQASKHGMNIARTWAFNDGDYMPLQTSPGSYNEDVFKAVLTRNNTTTGVLYKDDPTIFAWELINEPHCPTDPSGARFQNWLKEMAAHVKSIDNHHLLEIGLEGFYGASMAAKKQYNPNSSLTGTDFISNNQIPEIDFATIHIYPEQWLPSTNLSDDSQLAFVDKWIQAHILDSNSVLEKPLLIGEFGKSSSLQGYSLEKRNNYFRRIYAAIYGSAISGGSCAGGLFWQLLTLGMDQVGDGYHVVLEQSPSTAKIIGQQSCKLYRLSQPK
ncbi:hypothetical protein J1N35_026161 [Gossypium stocksii]|uniref:mannan endo-1,4-beta-mannosidase n=1 Tax=Gossypium stocksii TaxID=47602 RepID=A0A9D3ZYZ4_9ROSI|nr:hypothetical protein J1N35_026161 [Gossypium stocksii]